MLEGAQRVRTIVLTYFELALLVTIAIVDTEPRAVLRRKKRRTKEDHMTT
jgi:hypothetical protein